MNIISFLILTFSNQEEMAFLNQEKTVTIGNFVILTNINYVFYGKFDILDSKN